LTNRWWQLSACMIAMIAIANLQYTWTLFTVPLSTGLNAKLSDIQLAFTLFIVTQSWLVPVEGFLVDRLGARLVIVAGGLLVGLSWVGAGLGQSLRALYAWYVLFSGWGAARLLEGTGSWLPVLWAAFACNLLAAILAILYLKPMVARITARHA
jgi:OFA family oxalate/formate antiporter-like MFS transporter